MFQPIYIIYEYVREAKGFILVEMYLFMDTLRHYLIDYIDFNAYLSISKDMYTY